ncbi:MAG: molybdopterin-synthase adenylyltransferase MoeB [Chloroflexi bacterium]|nr:molybdopterin-synthase adenylyltransferase MoeB [Chloroflexota bacterium]MBK6710177.1 molybdopterin-synthase adenylyltransferase MoeB [Chloroflexota bacterium]MBK7178501.1 molybdopterin-synthase adenylyltransferase MoeB [Chloroflexota bacterium]MBP6802851.1 molybdopterin-synthase adenylyltransferase MoeB [Chloroflexota bacterium]MBP7591759.1 molybdopterin-synthase adenylyltransferase MoeB [Chloroflexota bacterium]
MITEQIAPEALADIQLSHEEVQRYSRHLIMPEVGMTGQKKLKAASVLLIGAGGLGSPLAMYLAAAGIGRIGLVDYDVVDTTNLQRQIIHGTKDVGRPKLDSAKERILDINPHVQVDTYPVPLTSANALEIFAPYDVIIDGTDNFPTRYLTNDACVLLGKPNVYGSIFRFEGQLSIFYAAEGPCYRCLFPEPPPPGLVPSCAEGGVLGILPGTVGAMQATEAIKLILGIGESMIGRLLLYDALNMEFTEVKLRKNPNCPVCSENPTLTELIDYEQFCGMPAHDRSLYAAEESGHGSVRQMSPQELKSRLDAGENLFILDVRERHEWDISNLSHWGARLIPKAEVTMRMGELDTAQEMVVQCRTGVRSTAVIRELQQHGFKKLWNLDGGINRWAKEVEQALPVY